ncbi:MAG: two-component regulator propeller domain-containing protein [Bacteroidota bacterium]
MEIYYQNKSIISIGRKCLNWFLQCIKKISTRISFIILATLFCLSAQGQYYFDKLTEENGLSDNRITCFLKDKTGFLWIGTKNGLNRYDGNSFTTFKPTGGNSISNEVINDIVQDAAGKIWVATLAGLNIYDPVTNHWETMMPSSSDVKGDLPSYLIWDLFADEKNRIWIVSDVWDLSVYDPVKKKIIYYDWPAVMQQEQYSKASRYRTIQKIERKMKTNGGWLPASDYSRYIYSPENLHFTVQVMPAASRI